MPTAVEHPFKSPLQIPGFIPVPIHLPVSLIGTWNNADHATRDLIKVVIAASGSGISVHPYGACTPTPCDWGSVQPMIYSANVGSTQTIAFCADFKFSFALVFVTGHLQGNQLIVETFTHFTDSSGRHDFYTTDTMVK